MQVIANAFPGIIVVSIEYPGDDARRWARLYDNHVLGWICDETQVMPTKPAAPSAQPTPLIVGSFPNMATNTAPILSPQWCKWYEPTMFVPDMLRATLPDFLTWLATNNGARRPLQARFGVNPALLNGFATWANANPDLVFDGDPPPPPG
jgi:hypothetical protein